MKRRREWYRTFFGGLYAEVLPATFAETETLAQARLVKRLLKLRRRQRVLDIPCGQGRVAVPLARMGLDVTGVDLMPGYIRRARRIARRAGVAVAFSTGDMREIDFEEEFHAAFNWFTSFGYFSDVDNLLLCRRVFRALRPGGRFLIEGAHKAWVLEHFRGRDDQKVGGIAITSRSTWNARTQRVTSHWTFRKGAVVERRSVHVRLFNGPELRKLLRRAGFREVELYGHPPTGRLHRHSRRLMAVGRRPKA
jgi:2-polyprenyl-3-methyl-5-hydroxy-6-metoxy-1,4-benzoquinol methylase